MAMPVQIDGTRFDGELRGVDTTRVDFSGDEFIQHQTMWRKFAGDLAQ